MMDSNDKFWTIIIAILAVAATIIIPLFNYQQNQHYKQMTEAGYEQATDTGTSLLVWKKVRPGGVSI